MTKAKIRRMSILVAALALWGCGLLGPPEVGAIRGSTRLCGAPGRGCTVTAGDDPPGNPITVTATGPERRTVTVTQSSPNPFMMDALPVGIYLVDASYPDFESGGRTCTVWWDTHEVEVTPNDTITISLDGSMTCRS